MGAQGRLVEEAEGLLRLDDDGRQAGAELDRIGVDALAGCDLVREADHVRGLFVEADEERGRREDAAHSLAHQLGDRVEVELAREGGTDLGDDRELRVALLGLGQETLRLVEEPRVLERLAEAGGERAQQAFVGLAEAIGLEALEGDDAEDAVAGQDRHAEPRLLRVRRAGEHRAPGNGFLGRIEAQGLPRRDDRRAQAIAERHLEARRALVGIDDVRET